MKGLMTGFFDSLVAIVARDGEIIAAGGRGSIEVWTTSPSAVLTVGLLLELESDIHEADVLPSSLSVDCARFDLRS